MIKNYYELIKPGIVYGNALTLITGFLLASKIYHRNSFLLLIATLIGMSCIIASGCIINNCIDRDIDAIMERTKYRSLVRGRVTLRNAIIFASIVGVVGILILTHFTNLLTTFIACGGLVVYTAVYTPLKRLTLYSTIVGSIAGAVPPVVGYVALSNHIDTAAIIIFLMLCLWQIPHFYAIAIYRLRDYAAAKLPVLPAVSGIDVTKIHMLFYIIAFTISSLFLVVYNYMGYIYLVIALIFNFLWFELCIYGFKITRDEKNTRDWARGMFFCSLAVLVVLCCTISISSLVH